MSKTTKKVSTIGFYIEKKQYKHLAVFIAELPISSSFRSFATMFPSMLHPCVGFTLQGGSHAYRAPRPARCAMHHGPRVRSPRSNRQARATRQGEDPANPAFLRYVRVYVRTYARTYVCTHVRTKPAHKTRFLLRGFVCFSRLRERGARNTRIRPTRRHGLVSEHGEEGLPTYVRTSHCADVDLRRLLEGASPVAPPQG